MADGAAAGLLALNAACCAVERWLTDAVPGWRVLSAGDLRSYDKRSVVAGWRIEVAFTDRSRRVDILIFADFPWHAARIALVDRPAHLTWPHIEADGLDCALPSAAEVDSTSPVEAVPCAAP